MGLRCDAHLGLCMYRLGEVTTVNQSHGMPEGRSVTAHPGEGLLDPLPCFQGKVLNWGER